VLKSAVVSVVKLLRHVSGRFSKCCVCYTSSLNLTKLLSELHCCRRASCEPFSKKALAQYRVHCTEEMERFFVLHENACKHSVVAKSKQSDS
jgi:hypothetical protein